MGSRFERAMPGIPDGLRKAITCADLCESQNILDSDNHLIDKEDDEGRGLLHYAAADGHPQVCLFLVHYEQGDNQSATPNLARMNKKDNYHYTALDTAVKYGCQNVSTTLRQLKAAGNDVGLVKQFIDATIANNVKEMKKLHKLVGEHELQIRPAVHELQNWEGVPLITGPLALLYNAVNAQGHSPLILASSMGNLKAVKWL